MKRSVVLLTTTMVLSIFALVACKKSTSTPANNNPTPATACNGMNLCLKLDNVSESHNSNWKVLSDRYRIYWEESSGSNYKNIELDIYATAKGKYDVVEKPSAGKAGFQYYIKDGSTEKNIQGISGTVEITDITSTTISGTFTLKGKDKSGTNYEITEGNFVNVPK